MELHKAYEYVLINCSKEKIWKTIARSRNRTFLEEDGPLCEFPFILVQKCSLLCIIPTVDHELLSPMCF